MNAGGRTTPPTGGLAVGGALAGVAVGAALAPVAMGVWAASAVSAGVATITAGIGVGVAVTRSAGSEIGAVATATGDRSGVDVAVGTSVGVSGGTGVSVGGRVAVTVGGARDGVAAGAAHAPRIGNKRSAANAARLNRLVFTRYNFSFFRLPELKMINKLHLRANVAFALILALSACSASDAPQPTQSAPGTVPAISATVAPPTTAVPAPTLAPTKPVKPTDEPGEDFTPKSQSVWDTQVGPDSLKGCSGGSILPAYGLVQVTPEGNSLVWKNQEPKPYTMTRVKPGVFAYEGPTALNDGTVKMVATFSGPTTVKMTRSFTPKAEASCVHTHEYTGVFKWETAPAATPKP